jgi:CheY-like chemotaxis protein
MKALQDARERNVDIVLLDYNMPGLDGFEILSEFRRLQSRVTVVIMTATDEAGLAERAKMAGAAAFLKKPFFPADVDAVLYRLYKIDAPARGF